MFDARHSRFSPQIVATACIRKAYAPLRRCAFAPGKKKPIVWGLLLLNLFLQLFDGLVSHHVLAQNVPEMNPLVAAMIGACGLSIGLLLSKGMAAALLAFVFLMRRQQPALVIKGLSLTAAVYAIHSIAWSYELLR